MARLLKVHFLSCSMLLIVFAISGCDLPKLKQNRSQLDKICAVYEMQGASENVALQLQRYLKDHSEDVLAWTVLGHVYNDLEQETDAANCYNEALALDPDTVEAITGQGILARRQGEYDKAMEFYERAISVDPNYAEAYASIVVIALKQGNDQKAVDYGVKGYELDNSDPTIAANLAIAYHYVGDVANQEKFFAVARRLGYRNIQTLQSIVDGELTIRD